MIPSIVSPLMRIELIYGSDSDSAQDDCAGEEDPQLVNSSSSSDDSFLCNDRNFRDDYAADRDVIEGNGK
jgi:hypothetical protein